MSFVKATLKLLIIAIILQSVSCGAVVGEDNKINVGVFNYEPLSVIHENGTISGQHIDMMESIALKQGWELEYIPSTWEKNLENLNTGIVDIVLAVPYSSEMDENYMLTKEILSTDWGVVYTYYGSNIISLQDLQGKKIAVCKNDYFYKSFNSSIKDSINNYHFIETEGYINVLELVDSKEVDAGIVSKLHAEIYAPNYKVKKISFVISPNDIVFAMSPTAKEEFRIAIEESIQEIQEEKESTNSLNTWESPEWLRFSVSIGGGAFLLLVILSIILKNKVEEKTEELNSKNIELENEIKERKLAEEKLKKYFIELKNSNELKDLFTDILRHDLINPATVIKGYIESLIEEEDNQQKVVALQTIERNNNNLIGMIDNAARLAKLESIEELEFHRTNIKDIINDVIRTLKPKLDESNMEIEFDFHGQYMANTNSIIEDVFSNIISNSLKYAPGNSKIKISIDKNDHMDWKIKIADSGDGISDESKEHIFDRFKRADKKNIKGSGLGLAIVKRIVDLHEGSVGVEDNPEGKGTIFWVCLKMA